ncbi:DUF6941 family protein [Parvibaculum sp.]|jgi:hypothetical protein|uniref:DUF6941 family protein n=1 Tax=Parvibaculum sp. TaxID=2024848 RepID=UPI002FD9CAF1
MKKTYPFGWVIFCDDVRMESNGKRIYIGTYSNVMYVNAGFPVTLPKLVITITCVNSIESPREIQEILVYVPGDPPDVPSMKIDISAHESAAREKSTRKNALGEPATERIMAMDLLASPLELKEPGKIRVIVLADGEEIEIGKLLVVGAPEAGSVAEPDTQ